MIFLQCWNSTKIRIYTNQHESTSLFCLIYDQMSKKNVDILIDFLNIFFDNINMKIRFSFQKHVRVMKLIVNVVDVSSLNHRELKSLINFLLFCVKIVVFNRFFLFHYTSLFVDMFLNIILFSIRAMICYDDTFFLKWNEIKFLRNKNRKLVNHMWIDASDNWNIRNHWQRSSQDFSFEIFNVKYNTRALRKSKYDIQTKKMNVVFYNFRK